MILDLFFFPIFLLVVHVMGVGALRLCGQREPCAGYVYLLAALMAAGFGAIAFNFFAGLASPYFLALLATMFLAGLLRARRGDFRDVKWALAFAALLTPIAAAMQPGYDGGLYHLPHQLWLRDNAIVFGLANVQSRFGFSSILEYISAPLWIGEQFKLLSYVSAVFVVAMLLFLLDAMRSQNRYFAVLALLTTAGLVLNNIYFDYIYTSTDTPAGILFLMTVILGMALMLEPGPVQKHPLTGFFLVALFALTMKANTATLALWVAFVLFALARAGRLTRRDFLVSAALPALLFVLWVVRSIIVSGCLLYPVVGTCLDVPWTAVANATENSNGITAWARHPATDLYSLTDWAWVTRYFIPRYWIFCVGIALASAIVAGCYRFFFRVRDAADTRTVRLAMLAFVLMCLGVWFYKAPTPRFGIGVFALLPAAISIGIFGFRFPDETQWRGYLKYVPAIGNRISGWAVQKSLVSLLVCGLILALTLKIGGLYLIRSGQKHKLAFDMLTVPVAQTVPHKHFGVKPKEGDQCWIVPECGPDRRPPQAMMLGHKYFAVGESNGN